MPSRESIDVFFFFSGALLAHHLFSSIISSVLFFSVLLVRKCVWLVHSLSPIDRSAAASIPVWQFRGGEEIHRSLPILFDSLVSVVHVSVSLHCCGSIVQCYVARCGWSLYSSSLSLEKGKSCFPGAMYTNFFKPYLLLRLILPLVTQKQLS
jgi:hypothetical protein